MTKRDTGDILEKKVPEKALPLIATCLTSISGETPMASR